MKQTRVLIICHPWLCNNHNSYFFLVFVLQQVARPSCSLTWLKENMEELACCPNPGLGELCPNAEPVLLKLKGELEALLLKLNPVLALCWPKG